MLRVTAFFPSGLRPHVPGPPVSSLPVCPRGPMLARLRVLGACANLWWPRGPWAHDRPFHRVTDGCGGSRVLGLSRLGTPPLGAGIWATSRMLGPGWCHWGACCLHIYFLFPTKIVVTSGTVRESLPPRPLLRGRGPGRAGGGLLVWQEGPGSTLEGWRPQSLGEPSRQFGPRFHSSL